MQLQHLHFDAINEVQLVAVDANELVDADTYAFDKVAVRLDRFRVDERRSQYALGDMSDYVLRQRHELFNLLERMLH